MAKKIMNAKHLADLQKSMQKSSNSVIYAPLSKSVCAAMLAGAMVLGGGVFVSTPLPAYADGYVDGTGNNVYYGFKTDAKYAEAHFNIDVEYYDTFDHAKAGGTEGIDPLGKFVRVHYLSNCHDNATADDWKFRPMWWFGVPAGLKDPQDIQFKRIEKLTKNGKEQVKPAGSSQYITTDANGYGAVSDKHFNSPKEWTNISNYYFSDKNILASKGWKQLMGLGTKDNKGYDNAGNTAQQWEEYQKQTQGLKGIFVDWESAGQRWYDMTYISEMEDKAWKERDTNPLRFAAGVYRFAGNWHYAVGQKHNTPKIADHFNLTYPAVTKVKDTKKLTSDEQTTVKNAIVDANKNAKYYSDLVDKVEVSENGDATITFKDNTTRTMPASLLVTKDETDKDKYKPALPTRTPVVNLKKLTPDEKTKIRQAIIDANGGSTPNEFLKHVKKNADSNQYEFNVKEDGSVEVTYEDDSKLTIPAEDLVYQGATIADWAPYVVPDTIEVENLKQLSDDDVTKIKNAFDTANADLDVYSNAKKKDSAGYLAIDKKTGNATIKWADGSTTVIDAWQFLQQKPKTTPSPNPQPPTPTPTAEKEFIVEAPQNQSSVNFDPFNAKDTDLTDPNNTQSLNSIKGKLKNCVAKDAKDNKTPVTIKDVEFKIEDGKGVVVFHADNYKDAKYPMSVFLKQKANKQTPQQPDTTLHHPGQMTAYKYYVDPVQVDNVNSPKPEDQIAAFKKFMKKNYNVDITDQEAMSAYTLKDNDKPVAGVENMQRYVKGQNNGAGVVSFSLNQDGTIAVQGFETGENNSKKLFDVPLTDLYVKKNSSQPQKDTTIDNLKQQAKDLLQKRTKTDGLTNDDLKRAGISDPDQLNDAKIDEIAKGQTAEKDLRDLIRKLTDAKKAERKYNEPGVVEFDKGATDDAKFKAAVKAFLKANYTNPEVVTDESITSPLTLPGALTAKNDTVYMGIDADGIKSLSKDASNNIVITPSKGDAFTVKVTYKQKEDKPTPSAEDLKKFKEQAKQQIDRNPKLTDEQKKQFKDKIDKADTDTKEKIQNILKEASEQAGKNNVNPNDIKKKENEEKEKREKEQKEKDNKEREKKQKEQTTKDKQTANTTIDNLSDLTQDEKDKLKEKLNGKNGDTTKPGAKTPEEVQQIVNEAQARNAAHKAIKDELPFLSHGKSDSNDDKALKELIGSDPAKKDAALTALEAALAKKDPAATADEIKNALDAAKRQNAINEENAKNAGIAKLDALLQQLTDAENGLNETQKEAVKQKVEAAKTAINGAKTSVKAAKKPSDIKSALDDVKIDDALKEINTQVTNAQKTNANDPSQTQNGKLGEEKKKAKEEIDNIPGLTPEEKDKYKQEINDSTHSGDPEAVVNRAKKHKKIKDALKAIDNLDHLNDAQKKAYKDIINTTDAGNHKDDNGNDTGVDDIDDALANAANTDNAMARLEELKKNAEALKGTEKYTGANVDPTKKAAFDKVLQSVDDLLNKDKGDAKGAPEVNDLYTDLLNKMRDLDSNAQSAGLKTDALSKEIESDKKLKPNDQANPKTPGDSVYTTASKDKKKAFDDALTAAEQALKTAEDTKKPGAAAMDADAESKAQKAVDDALDKLVKARLALDGVNTKPLEQQIAKDADINKSVRYTKASEDKKKAYDDALAAAKKLITDLTTPSADGTTPKYGETKLDTKENKQKALGEALKKLQDAVAALDGTKPIEPAPTPTPTPTPTPSPLPTPGAGTGNVGSGSEAGYGVNDNAPTTVDKGELNIQIDSAESDLQPGNAGNGNAGNGNAGSNNAGNAANSGANSGNAGNAASNNAGSNAANANAANGANSAAVNAAVESNQAVKQADAQVSKAQAALDAALAEAKKVAADPNATQAQVDAAAQKLSAARKALAAAKAHAAEVRASVRAQVLKSGSAAQLSKTGSDVSAFGLFAATISAAGAALFAAKRRGISRHSNK